MRISWSLVKSVFLLGVVVFLYAFSSHKNNSRPIKGLEVQFTGKENVFITSEMVDKLLIQSHEELYFIEKDAIDLKEMEFVLTSNAMVKSAQVYLTVSGEVRAKVEQKTPIARVYLDAVFYIDEDGFKMPLSSEYSARVPLVFGIEEEEDLKSIYKVALQIYKDAFLKTHITEIVQKENKEISLKMRIVDFEVLIGNLENLEEKLNNLKAFYQKAKKDNMLDIYKSVNLQFNNQVVCTKK
jgi:cell division protein FtsQ|tara:strand:- start:3867 stop:4586 length:720 start_codon:yes stop_codon:yes gene_type:complete